MCTLTVSVRIRFFFCTTFSLCIWNVCIWKRDIKAKFVYRYMLIIVILLSKKKDVIKDCFLQTCSHMLIIVTLHSKKKKMLSKIVFYKHAVICNFWNNLLVSPSKYIYPYCDFQGETLQKKEKFSIENVLPIISFIYHWICSCSVYSNQCFQLIITTLLHKQICRSV